MIVKNKTRNRIIVKDCTIASGYFGKMRGLMFRKSLGKDSGMLMVFGKDGRYPLWMPFMNFPIDVIFMDRQRRVVDVKENLKPMSLDLRTWRLYSPEKNCRFALETNKGVVKSSGTAVGDVIEF